MDRMEAYIGFTGVENGRRGALYAAGAFITYLISVSSGLTDTEDVSRSISLSSLINSELPLLSQSVEQLNSFRGEDTSANQLYVDPVALVAEDQ